MASQQVLNHLKPLTAEQLLVAELPYGQYLGGVLQGEAPVGELEVLHGQAFTREPSFNTPFEGLDRYRWLGHALLREFGQFEADVRYADSIEAVDGVSRQIARLGEDEIVDALAVPRSLLEENRRKRYPINVRQLGSFIRQQDNFYIGYGISGAVRFRVAKLVDVAAAAPNGSSYRAPVPILQGHDGKVGRPPVGMRVRREMLVTRKPLATTDNF